MSARADRLSVIAEHHQAEEMEGHLMDATTARMLMTLYQALSPENRARFDSVPLPKLVAFGWSKVQ